VCLRYLRSHEGIFEIFDGVISERIQTDSVSIGNFSGMMEEIAAYNQNCQPGDEVTLQLVCLEGEEFVSKNLEYIEKSQLVSIIGGYCTSGVMG
jgi:hypothetical protein